MMMCMRHTAVDSCRDHAAGLIEAGIELERQAPARQMLSTPSSAAPERGTAPSEREPGSESSSSGKHAAAAGPRTRAEERNSSPAKPKHNSRTAAARATHDDSQPTERPFSRHKGSPLSRSLLSNRILVVKRELSEVTASRQVRRCGVSDPSREERLAVQRQLQGSIGARRHLLVSGPTAPINVYVTINRNEGALRVRTLCPCLRFWGPAPAPAALLALNPAPCHHI